MAKTNVEEELLAGQYLNLVKENPNMTNGEIYIITDLKILMMQNNIL